MRVFQFVRAFFIATIFWGVLEGGENKGSDPDISWEMSHLSEPLTANQVLFLNLYMQYSSIPPMNKVPKYVQEILPLYIEFHSAELDSYALQYFRVKQLLSAGLKFSDVMTLQSAMRDLQLGNPLDHEQNEFLKQFMQKDIKKLPQLSLIPLLQPLFFYVNQNSDIFDKKMSDILRKALLKSVGCSSKEMSTLEQLSNRPLNALQLSGVEVSALQKWLTLSALHAAIDVYDAGQILRLQAVIHKHVQHFSKHAVAFLDNEVNNSRVVHKFRYANFQGSRP